MSEITLNGPAVKDGITNMVLQDALLHSPVVRYANSTDYHRISIGIREGAYTSWIGTWSQKTQKTAAGAPVSVLDDDRPGMRLQSGQTIVVKIEAHGTPDSLTGSRVNFRLARVGGETGSSKPLVSSGASVADRDSRTALSALERQVNAHLSEWEVGVQLEDPVVLAGTAAFHGRLQVDSTTQISLQRYIGNWVEVDGVAVSIGVDGLECDVSDGLLASTGTVTATSPPSDALYYAYVGANGLHLSDVAPTSYLGAYYLGSSGGGVEWRFCGWVYVSDVGEFTDSETARELVNYHNRLPARLFTCPDYGDDNLDTVHTLVSVTWAKLNGGGGSDVSFIANGEDGVRLCATFQAYADVNATFGAAVSIDGVTDIETGGYQYAAANVLHSASIPRLYVPSSAGRHVASIVGCNNAGTVTFLADRVRNGAVADPAHTFLSGWVMA